MASINPENTNINPKERPTRPGAGPGSVCRYARSDIFRGGHIQYRQVYSIYLSCIMINTTDLQELEVSLPGDWLRKDNGDTYSFTTDNMKLRDERLFRDLHVRRKGGQTMSLRYALTIEEDYCGVMLNDDEFIVRRLVKHEDGSAMMEWQDSAGGLIVFDKLPQATV